MKTIGLLTMPLNTNYGGIIQLVALQDFLKSEGYETLLLDRRHGDSKMKRLLKTIIEDFSPIDFKDFKFRKNMASDVHEFIDNYAFPKTNQVFNDSELQDIAKNNLTAIIVGSDQVWRIDYMRDLYQNAFLNFVSPPTKKISYAASFGKGEWTYKEKTKEIKGFLNSFNAISVREDSAVEIVKNEFNLPNVELVVDPTLLMSKEYYEKYLPAGSVKSGKGIFTYVLDKTPFRKQVIDSVAKELNLPTHTISISKDFNELKQTPNYKLPKLEEWLRGFYEADFVVTDSFHGTIFSIIFNKPFISIANKKRGVTRFTSVLKQLDIQNRLVFDDTPYDFSQVYVDIDYNSVNTKLENWKKQSKEFLITAIEES